MRPFKGKKKKQTVWDAVWIDAASECGWAPADEHQGCCVLLLSQLRMLQRSRAR
jgi:hypothetical protein